KTNLFKNLKIQTEENIFFERHCRTHPVLHLDFGSVRGGCFAGVKKHLAVILAVNGAFVEHKYVVKKTDNGTLVWASEKLKNVDINVKTFGKYIDREECTMSDEVDLKYSLKFLSEVLHAYYEEKVFILIDEYDALTMNMVFGKCSNKDDIDLMVEFLKCFMANTLKFNNFVKRSLIFACDRLSGAFSGDSTR
ncbi:AAA-ATPase like domain containing protein, partial [Asbolus verrucosus]